MQFYCIGVADLWTIFERNRSFVYIDKVQLMKNGNKNKSVVFIFLFSVVFKCKSVEHLPNNWRTIVQRKQIKFNPTDLKLLTEPECWKKRETCEQRLFVKQLKSHSNMGLIFTSLWCLTFTAQSRVWHKKVVFTFICWSWKVFLRSHWISVQHTFSQDDFVAPKKENSFSQGNLTFFVELLWHTEIIAINSI